VWLKDNLLKALTNPVKAAQPEKNQEKRL